MTFDDTPPALRIKRNWCLHRHDGERAKVPHAPAGYKMAWSIPANWINFIEATKAYEAGLALPEGHKCRFDGIGFIIAMEKDSKLDIIAVDLDDCVKDGKIDPWAKTLLDKLNSYSEYSPSGTGIHIFVKGKFPEGTKNTNDQMADKNRVEVFVHKHHITVTGKQLKEYSSAIEDRSEEIKKIYDEVMKVKAAKKEEAKKNKVKKNRVLYDAEVESKKKYVAAAIEDEIAILKGTTKGQRNNQLNRSAFAIGQFVGAHYISRKEAERELEKAARFCGMDESKDGISATIASGLDDGQASPREIPTIDQVPLPKITVSPIPECQVQSEAPKKEAIANVLVKLAIKNSLEIWHTPQNEGYITVPINSHKEYYKLTSKAVKTWLGRIGHELMGKVVSGTAIKDALNVLEGKAIYDGKEYQLHIRKAEYEGKIYVDMGDVHWKVIEISREGWMITTDCPVKFRRSKNSLPFPIPVHGGEIDDLRELINAQSDDTWILILAWLTQAFWCRGPYAHLYLRGGQGTTKSFMMQILKAIADPSAATKRRLPKSERDAAIALGSESISCFDNLSGLNDGIADLFCVASTGGVSTQRALFTDEEESVINIKCPIISNGIEDLGQRGDLLDRTIVIDLEPILEADRKPEKVMESELEAKRASLLGSLLDLTVQGLNNQENITLSKSPRMADFAQWACACLGDAASEFINVYSISRNNTSIDLADSNRLPFAIYSFIMNRPDKKWEGNASMLLADLNHYAGIIPGRELESWPKTPDKMGSELRRFSQALESKSIYVTYFRAIGKRMISIFYRDTGNDSVPKVSPEKPLASNTMYTMYTTLDKVKVIGKSTESTDEKLETFEKNAKYSVHSVQALPDNDFDSTHQNEVSSSDILEEATKSISSNRGLLTPFRLACRARDSFNWKGDTKQAEAWLIANGYEEQDGTWIPKPT